MQHPPQRNYTNSPPSIRPGPTAQRSSSPRVLPERNVDGASIEDAYVAFILYCNPGVPFETDTAALREAFRTPPKSGGKTFSTFALFELIKKLETKELKTWAELALKLGVEPPDQEKGQSSQKIQQYAVRLKRWMKSMHVDAFFEYLIGRPSPYWTEIPPEHLPIAELERDGVAAEDDMALRALLPQIKPRRGKRKPEEDETGKSPSQRPSPQADEYGAGGPPQATEPWTAQPDGRESVFLFPPVPDPSRLNAPGHSWTNSDIVQTPMSAYPIPQSAITPSTRNTFWADEPKLGESATSTVNNTPPASITTAQQGSNARPTPVSYPQPTQDASHLSPVQEAPPPRPAKRSRLSLQVPERVGGEVRLATPPLPEPVAPPVVMVNGQTTEPRPDPATKALSESREGRVNTIFTQASGTLVGSSLPPGLTVGGEQRSFSQDPTDRTNMDEIEALFVSSLLQADWYDAKQNRIPPCSVDEAYAFSQRVIDNLLKAATTKEAFLINLSALAGGKLLMHKGSLRVTRLEELPDRTRYSCKWQLRYGDIVGDMAMEETVMHEKWKKPKKDDQGGINTAGGTTSATPNGTGGPQTEEWERRYRELADTLQQRDEELMRLRAKCGDIAEPRAVVAPEEGALPQGGAGGGPAEVGVDRVVVRQDAATEKGSSCIDTTSRKMPRQYVVCGRPVPRLGTRHVSLLLVSLALFAVFSLVSSLPGSTSASLRAASNRFSVPKSLKSPWMNKLNPFKQPIHPPASQKNDTDGESVWYADWNWLLMPFSSSVTLDENRALLPMLKERTPVYCYYDNTVEKDRSIKEAESDLLLTWRRAWWAQGFKPTILGPLEAMNNPMYEELQKLQDLKPALKTDLMRWLAWENMGDGMLAQARLFPMGPHDDPLLTYLRRGEFPKLTRFKDLDDGLFVGSKNEVGAAIKAAMISPNIKEAEGLIAAVESDKKENPFTVDDAPKSLAYYSARQIQTLYPKVGEATTTAPASQLKSLNQLITSHLHVTWQNIFTDGIAVVKPLPHHTTHLITPAYELASKLAHCLESPLPDTCPPNRPNCRPCDDTKPMKITTPSSYTNTSTLYTIGTVPHPYTSSTLNSLKSQISIAWIRREAPRDAWITSLTSSLFPDSISTTPRLLRFKEAVAASEDTTPGGGAARSLWLPAEQALPDDLDWHFGFALPDSATYATDQASTDAGTGATGGGGNTPPPHNEKDGPLPTKEELALEPELFARAQTVVLHGSKSKPASIPGAKAKTERRGKATKEDLAIRNAIEAWNLADTEAWRFARAYLARKTVERRKWEEEEARYADGMGSEKKSARKKSQGQGAWDRWLDRRE
ncbi:ARS binding protein 2-domain-containing protein [Achaetomium macrosporum]|uniref:ARS binding protein 2-domain-containing protein n=1 Tax=Achaetomium macrosporum TaxID=79813 RepID=A0AAN7CCE9_9PEZI|nr:ARS binding protein 2-domain-containing protein [Achaetomium macrosporum]